MEIYHVFYENDLYNKSSYFKIDYLVQIASILFSKKNYNNINLYCNSSYLESIKEFGIDKIYNTINTECLDNLSNYDFIRKYWSFPKIEAAKDISSKISEFCIIDTDLWIHEKLDIDGDYQFIGYHPEQQYESDLNPYISPKKFLQNSDYKLFNWDSNPINCAFIYLNSPELISEWHKWSLKTISLNKDKEDIHMSGDTIFIEQRLLPVIAHSLGMKVGTLIPNVYQPHISSDDIGSEWIPNIGFDKENEYMSWNIKHVWGLKKMYDDYNIRFSVIEMVVNSLDTYFPNWKFKYNDLYKSCIDYLENSKLLSK